MNIKLLQRIKRVILKRPEQFNMGTWFQFGGQSAGHNCGTSACLAGWAITMQTQQKEKSKKKFRPLLAAKSLIKNFGEGENIIGGYSNHLVKPQAEKILGLDSKEGARLFYQNQWPFQFKNRYDNAFRRGDWVGMAQAAADRIDHFIATKGTE